MNYISICSGIEAATVAWKGLNWNPIAFAEIEKFPNEVLKYHYPNVPNLGDITKVDWTKYEGKTDLIIGGTPCQSFSIAGERKGFNGASGLITEYFRILTEVKPTWFIWENVPGVLSSNKGEDFQFILRKWNECGYNVSWRILDAQYFGVPQRRRRIYVIGHNSDWRKPIKVLFDQDCLRRIHKKSKEQKSESTSIHNQVLSDTTIVFKDRCGKEGGGKGILCSNKSFTLATSPDEYLYNDNIIRRFTPLECERLQGFPDNYTNVLINNKEPKDSYRYKALGNSMAVPVITWLGKQIEKYS